jgi:hypothetical protein
MIAAFASFDPDFALRALLVFRAFQKVLEHLIGCIRVFHGAVLLASVTRMIIVSAT